MKNRQLPPIPPGGHHMSYGDTDEDYHSGGGGGGGGGEYGGHEGEGMGAHNLYPDEQDMYHVQYDFDNGANTNQLSLTKGNGL